jgi:hypothetical protein
MPDSLLLDVFDFFGVDVLLQEAKMVWDIHHNTFGRNSLRSHELILLILWYDINWQIDLHLFPIEELDCLHDLRSVLTHYERVVTVVNMD